MEDFLADFLDDSFSTYAEDDSPAQVSWSGVQLAITLAKVRSVK